MIEESEIQSLRGAKKVPEYRPTFPPKIEVFYDNNLVDLVGKANLAIGDLNSAARVVPNPDLLIGPLLLRESLSSSKIEGTQASVRDVLKQEADIGLTTKIFAEVVEVRNHQKTTLLGLEMLKKLPISNRMFKEMHKRLMYRVRGEIKRRGDFRIGSNAIAKNESADAIIFLPPPAKVVPKLMSKLEVYINQKAPGIDPIIRCALIHYEFEAIHPFADGNGRLGRVLNSLFLIEQEVLEYPLLYLSGYLLRNKDEYYGRLLRITTHDEWKPWLEFFLKGVQEQAQNSRRILESIFALYKKHKEIAMEEIPSKHGGRLVDLTFRSPITTAVRASKQLGLLHNTTMGILRNMVRLGLLNIADTRKTKNIPFSNEKLIALLQRS